MSEGVGHYVLFAGGRDTVGPDVDETIRDILFFQKHFYGGVGLGVLHGGARGFDESVDTVACSLGIKVKAFPLEGVGEGGDPQAWRERMCSMLVDWERRGHSTEVICLPGGRSVSELAGFAARLGLSVTDIPLDGHGVTHSSTMPG
jgi:hypothetical protein